MTRRQWAPALVCGVVAMLLGSQVSSGQPARQPAPPVSVGSPSEAAASIPAWLAWKVFHESLAFYNRQSTAQVNGMLASNFGLGSAEGAMLLNAGQSFVAAIARIDADAKAEVQARYGTDKRPTNVPRPPDRQMTGPAPSGRPIMRDPGKTLRDMVRESGLYDKVEGKKRAALAAHLSELERALGPLMLARMDEWVQTSVAPHIKTVDRGVPVPGVDRSSSGAGPFVTRPLTER